jgi:hypothetical protein
MRDVQERDLGTMGLRELRGEAERASGASRKVVRYEDLLPHGPGVRWSGLASTHESQVDRKRVRETDEIVLSLDILD